MTMNEEKKIRYALSVVLGRRVNDVYIDRVEETTAHEKKVFATVKNYYQYGAIVINDRVIQTWRIIA